MELPDFLPEVLKKYKACENEDALFQTLRAHPPELIQFFLNCVEQETWCAAHPQVMKDILAWLTVQSFENRLGNTAFPLSEAIQRHYHVLDGLLPFNVTLIVDEVPIAINSFLFSHASSTFKDLISTRSQEKNQTPIVVSTMNLEDFRLIEEHVKKGEVGNLWKKTEDELLRLRGVAAFWGLHAFAHEIEDVLKRYITRGNCFLTLTKALRDRWPILLQAALKFINEQQWPLHIKADSNGEGLHFSFLEFNEASLEVFEEVKHEISMLHVENRLMEDPAFSYVVNACSKLKGLDLNHTDFWSERLKDCPEAILELDLSFCTWLLAEHLQRLSTVFPRLKKLVMHSNMQLGAAAWGMLHHFHELVDVDISYNPQIGDDELRIILQACPNLTDLTCEECRKLTDKGFYDIVRLTSQLHSLRFKQVAMTDGLLIEIGQRLRFLHELKIENAVSISDRGLLEFVRQAGSLRQLEITKNDFRSETIAEIKKMKPMLTVLAS